MTFYAHGDDFDRVSKRLDNGYQITRCVFSVLQKELEVHMRKTTTGEQCTETVKVSGVKDDKEGEE